MAPFEVFYRCRFRSSTGWFKVDEAALVGSDSILKDMEKVQLIRKRLKTTQSRQKLYADVR